MGRTRSEGKLRRWAAALAVSLCAARHAGALVGGQYDAANNAINNAVIINDAVGATTFYNYSDFFGNLYHTFGTGVIVANIEGGSVWNGHEALTRVDTYFPSLTPPTTTPAYTNHATGVGMVIAGGQPDVGSTTLFESGIAPGATLWSGNIATSFDAATGSFEMDDRQFVAIYRTAFKTGIGGQTADVINSSWGTSAAGGLTSNNHFYAVTVDALAAQTGKTLVFAAGNDGPGANTVTSPATSYNSIVVGATAFSVDNPYAGVAAFSARSPTDGFVPTGKAASPDALTPGVAHAGARTAVSIVAPGDMLFPAYYDPTDPAATGLYAVEGAGTSYAAPVVAGAVALIVEAGRTWFDGVGRAVDARVVKAVLMNSADKTPNWDNGQTTAGGVVRTTRALDYAAGAGRLNLTRAFGQYLNGSVSVDETGAGAPVLSTGWAFGLAHPVGPTDYAIVEPLAAGTRLTVTLDWFVNSTLADGADVPEFGSFANLDLQVWRLTGGLADALVAESASEFQNVEHLSFLVPADGEYLIRVLWNGELYDRIGAADEAAFGLAWGTDATVPEPGVMSAVAGLGWVLMCRRRRGPPPRSRRSYLPGRRFRSPGVP